MTSLAVVITCLDILQKKKIIQTIVVDHKTLLKMLKPLEEIEKELESAREHFFENKAC